MGTPPVPARLKTDLPAAFKGPFVLFGGCGKAGARGGRPAMGVPT
jgi:N-ethylmaleimide reductase